MGRDRVDYDRLASVYHTRYAVNPLAGIGRALTGIVEQHGARRVLEVGCGTGRWLGEIGERASFLCGADASFGMLRAGDGRHRGLRVAARANQLPFRPGSFDLIFCVNALHHFDDQAAFIRHAGALLRRGGVLAIVGLDPRLVRRWYLYEYFHPSFETDLRRYASFGQIVDWMARSGFERVEYRVVERVESVHRGREFLSAPFLAKDSSSAMALLTDTEYAAGLARVRKAIEDAEREAGEATFIAEFEFAMVAAFRC